MSETYLILKEWQGQGTWGMPHSINKKKLANITNSGDYKKLSVEFDLIGENGGYKSMDKLSPKYVKSFLEHIDELKTEKAEQIFRYSDFKIIISLISILLLYNKNSE